MNLTLDQMIDAVIRREGGYVNHPNDPGGATKYGITERVARQNGYSGDMRYLDEVRARLIYRAEYFIKPGFNKVAAAYNRVGNELFDTGVNMGTSVAAGFLQRALNVQEDITLLVDNDLGPKTFAALDQFKRRRGSAGEGWLIKALDAMQGSRYIELAEKRAKSEAFVYGWIDHRLGNA